MGKKTSSLLRPIAGIAPLDNGWHTRDWRIWAGSRLGALLVGAAFVWALFGVTGQQPLREPLATQTIIVSALDTLPVKAPVPTLKPPSPVPLLKPLPKPLPQPAPKNRPQPIAPEIAQQVLAPTRPSEINDRPTPTPTPTPTVAVADQTTIITPRIATVPSTQSTPSSNPVSPNSNIPKGASKGASQGLSHETQAMLKARACARLDIADRPADCPPNAEILQMLAAARGPIYRPENAEGFSRNELSWRGIPPPCVPSGSNSAAGGLSVCIRVGNVPSRVRSVREICEARGLGGCADAPAQAAVNAAIEQVRRQQAGN